VCYFVILSNSLFLIIFSTDIIDRNELRLFFETNCSQIYFIFYENFITLESNLKQKGKTLSAFLSLKCNG